MKNTGYRDQGAGEESQQSTVGRKCSIMIGLS